ncbi:DUF998 domain-containing protein [Chloroflexota bacterium]
MRLSDDLGFILLVRRLLSFLLFCYHTYDMDKQTATSTPRIKVETRHLLWIGVMAPILIVVLVLIAAAVTPNYSHLYHAVSRLGISGMPHPAVLNASMIVYGLAMCVFAYAVYDKLGRNRDARLLSISIVAHGIGVMFAGVFNDEVVSSGQTISAEAIVHTAFAVISYAALLVLMVVFNIMLHNTPFRKRLIWFTAVVVLVSMPLVALFIFKAGNYLGLFQRLGYGIALFWVVVVTLKLILFLRQLAKLT